MQEVIHDSVSVIIPAYNGAQVLGRALASVDAQTRPPDEIIVVDDGSPQPMESIVAVFDAGKRSGVAVRYIRQTNTGVAGARNCGIKAARGTLIAFLDQDDEWLPPHLEQKLSLARREKANLVAGDCLVYGHSQAPTTFLGLAGFLPHFEQAPLTVTLPGLLDRLLRFGCFFVPCSVLVQRDFVLANGGLDPDLSGVDDYELWIRLSLTARMAWDSVPTAVRWLHDANVSHNHALMSAQSLRLWRKVYRMEVVRRDPALRGIVRRRLSSAWLENGYYGCAGGYLPDADRARARSIASPQACFAASLRLAPSFRAVVYLAAACLPAPLLRYWRSRPRMAPIALS